jgi:hypothetical protein
MNITLGRLKQLIRESINEDIVDDVSSQSLENMGDLVSGGMSKEYENMSHRMTLKAIAQLHSVEEEKIMSEFEIGVKEEMEHTDSVLIACEIAIDHLVEAPDYYTRLEDAGL